MKYQIPRYKDFKVGIFPDKPYLPVKYRVNKILSYLTCIHIAGDFVLTLTANDGDAGATVEYSITGKVRLRITKTSPYNEDPLTSHLHIVKLGFTGVYIFLSFALKHRLWVLVRTASLRRF